MNGTIILKGECIFQNLGGKNTSATSFFDLLLGYSRKEPGFDNDWLLRQVAFAENLEIASTTDVNNGSLLVVLLILDTRLLGHE